MSKAQWSSNSELQVLATKLATKDIDTINSLCDKFANGSTYQGKLVYVSKLRSALRELNVNLDNLDMSKDVEL